jgi:hypothetical protein
MDNATLVFETLIRYPSFMDQIDTYINKALQNGIIEAKDIPQMVYLIMQLLQTRVLNDHTKNKLTVEDTHALLELYRTYIISKLVCEFDTLEFNKIYNICVKLAVMKLKFSTKTSKSCFRP